MPNIQRNETQTTSYSPPIGAQIAMDAARGLAAGIRAYLEAKVMVHQAKTEREKQFARRLLDEKRLRLQEQQQELVEGRFQWEQGVPGQAAKAQAKLWEREDKLNQEKIAREDQLKNDEYDRQEKRRSEAIQFYEKKIERLQAAKATSTDHVEQANIQAEIDRVEANIERLITHAQTDSPASADMSSDLNRTRRKERIQRIQEGYVRGEFDEDEFQRRLDKEYGIAPVPAKTTDTPTSSLETGADSTNSADSERNTLEDTLEATLAQRDEEGNPVYGEIQKNAIRASGGKLAAIELEPWAKEEQDVFETIADANRTAAAAAPDLTPLHPSEQGAILIAAREYAGRKLQAQMAEVLTQAALLAPEGENRVDFAVSAIQRRTVAPGYEPYRGIGEHLQSNAGAKWHGKIIENILDRRIEEARIIERENTGQENKESLLKDDEAQQYVLSEMFRLGLRNLDADMRRMYRGQQMLLMGAERLQRVMNTLKRQEMDFSLFDGTWSDIRARLIGAVTDSRYETFRSELKLIRSAFMQIRSGLTMTNREQSLYDDIFALYLKNFDTATARIEGLIDESQAETIVTARGEILGAQHFELFDIDNIKHAIRFGITSAEETVLAEPELSKETELVVQSVTGMSRTNDAEMDQDVINQNIQIGRRLLADRTGMDEIKRMIAEQGHSRAAIDAIVKGIEHNE